MNYPPTSRQASCFNHHCGSHDIRNWPSYKMSTGVSSGSPYPTNIYILAKRLNSCEARNLRHFTYQRNVLAWLSQAFCWYNSLYLLVKVRKKIIANRCSFVNENYEWWAFISDTSNREFPPDFLNLAKTMWGKNRKSWLSHIIWCICWSKLTDPYGKPAPTML